MSSSSSASISEVAYEYQDERTGNTISLVVTTLLAYDALLCVNKEVRYVWWSPTSSRNIRCFLYMYNRYMSIIWNILNIGFIATLSNFSCTALSWLTFVLSVLTLLGPALFTTLRVYALSERKKMLTVIVLLLSMGPFLVNASTLYQQIPINLPPPYGCSTANNTSIAVYISLAIISRASIVLADTIAAAVTWRRTRAARRASTDVSQQSSLEQILWENGNIYFCTLVALNLADIILVVLSVQTQPGEALYIIDFIDPISSVLNSRFLLALYETNAHLVDRGGTLASSFSTLAFGEGDRAESPELPEFLSSLAGPIHSVSNNNEELFEFEMTSEQRADGEEALDGDVGATIELTAVGEVGEPA